MNDCEEGLVQWLNLFKSVVDSVDVPSNISRETFQHKKILREISKNLVKKCPEMLQAAAGKKDGFEESCEQLGTCLELGIFEHPTNQKIVELLRVNTSKSGESEGYVDRLKHGRNDIC